MERQKRTWDGFLFSWISMLLLTVSATKPKIIGCELLEHEYMTCYWTGNISDNVTYMMRVKTTNCLCNCSISTNCQITMDSCNTTTTHCSVKINSVSHCFCVDVLVFGSSITTSLEEYCFHGINEVKMNPPKITKLAMLQGNATCLRLEWSEPHSEYLPSERNDRVIQIEYHTPQQAHFPNVNTLLHDWRTNLCSLYPGTKHLVRVRAQDLRAAHHWSSWSGFAEATTAEAAPVSAPELWRHIKPVDGSDQRRITLLWKPLQWPHTNGVILRYAASCRDEQHSSSRDCDHLDSQSTSCIIYVSPHACDCSLNVSNSAGTSPSAHIYIPGEEDTELGPPENISVVALDDFELEVEWTATVKQSESSFVVEWFPIPDTTVVGLSWRILKGSAKSFIITGVYPEIPYNVSVRVLHNITAGAARFVIAFTRQGAPSVGPKLEVIQPSSNDVTLKWQPVPLEKLRGFIQHYTVLYKYNGKIKSQKLSGDSEQFSLNALSPGEYTVCVKAHTLAGGAESPWVTVTIGSVHIPVTTIVLCTAVTLILVIFLSQTKRIQQCICPIIPDPSKSSLSIWPSVCPHQHNLPNMDFKSSPLLFKPISTRGEITGHRRHHHQHQPKDSNLQAFSSQINKQLCVQDSRTFSEPNVEEPTEEPTTDLGYQNTLRATQGSSHNVSSDCLEGPDVGTTEVDSVFYKGNVVPCSETYLPLDCPALREDTLDPEDFFYKRKLVSKLCPKTCCYSHVSTSYLPDADSYIDFRTVAYNSTNLICESNHFSRLESSYCSHVSTGYLPVPEPSLDYADFVSVNTADFPHQSNQMPKYLARGYMHVSTSYLPLPLARSEADFTNSVHDNNYKSGLNSCIYSNVQTSYQKSCPDLETDDVYRAL